MKYAAAADIGGTNTRIALVNEHFQIEERVRFSTDTDDPDHTLRQICETVRSFPHIVEGLGLSCPGPLDLVSGKVLTPPNLFGRWHNLDITKELETELQIPVYLENDANLAALAEAKTGAGKGLPVVQFFTVSTGFGAGLILNGKIFHGAHGFANEVANTILWKNGPAHGSILPGGIEALCSGSAIKARAENCGLAVSHAGEVTELARRGDPEAQKIMQEAEEYLANYLAGVIGYTDTDIIILGGSVALKTEGFIEEVQDLVKQKVYSVMVPYIRIEKAALGDDSGLLGAACLVFDNQ
jgi:glucokinase